LSFSILLKIGRKFTSLLCCCQAENIHLDLEKYSNMGKIVIINCDNANDKTNNNNNDNSNNNNNDNNSNNDN